MRVLDRLIAALTHGKVVVLKQYCARLVGIVVELIDQKDIWPDNLNHFRDSPDLARRARGQLRDQPPLCRAVHRCIEGGDANTCQ
ncbi:MAG: hypothetical protein R3F19_32010 [Verrucomicrobiales bacterium]